MNPMIMIMGLINEFTDDKSIEEYFFDNKDFIVRKICKSDKNFTMRCKNNNIHKCCWKVGNWKRKQFTCLFCGCSILHFR